MNVSDAICRLPCQNGTGSAIALNALDTGHVDHIAASWKDCVFDLLSRDYSHLRPFLRFAFQLHLCLVHPRHMLDNDQAQANAASRIGHYFWKTLKVHAKCISRGTR